MRSERLRVWIRAYFLHLKHGQKRVGSDAFHHCANVDAEKVAVSFRRVIRAHEDCVAAYGGPTETRGSHDI